MEDLKNAVESVLFSAAKKLSVEELSSICRVRDLNLINQALVELKKELDNKNSSILLLNEGSSWRLAVRDKYLPFVQKVVTQTELTKSVVETLAVVAFKSPVLQSEVIRVRTNKAYSHIDELEELGYISREKKGRTKLIKLSQKFFDYFDLPEAKLNELFSKPQNPSPQTTLTQPQEDVVNLLKILDL